MLPEIQNFILTANSLPFFCAVGDGEYRSVLDDLVQTNFALVRMSDLCPNEDKFPSVDGLIKYFMKAEGIREGSKFAVVGLGECLALQGSEIAAKELRRLKDTLLGNARFIVVLLLRGVSAQIDEIIRQDHRISARYRAFFASDPLTKICITNVPNGVMPDVRIGIKHLIRVLEDGAVGSIYASSSLDLKNSLIPIESLTEPYSCIEKYLQSPALSKELGTDEQWATLVHDLRECGGVIEQLFKKYGIDKKIFGKNLVLAVSGIEYKNWLIFLYLKIYKNKIENRYLKRVVNETQNYEELKNNLLVMIVSFTHSDEDFKLMYDERKNLIKDFPEEDIAIFLKQNEILPEESIYRLTDNTLLEKKTVVKWIASYGLSDEILNKAISYVYPALYAYLSMYKFTSDVLNDEIAEELTIYFDLYKKQKVLNVVSDEFIQLVKNHASKGTYAKLQTRENAINAISNKSGAYLYWIDALGVEYLSYIVFLADQKKLSIRIEIVRANLPTITATNSNFFYNEWSGMKFREDKLDKIKHNRESDFYFGDDKDPIHIPTELEVIEKAINTAAVQLRMQKCKSFVIVSDHGTSRLAVIKGAPLYDVRHPEIKGEHSGRCCKYYEGCNVSNKFVVDKEYIVLSDYGRFEGSKPAHVEVHGGGSLEEIVIPVITLTLKKQENTDIVIINPDNITADRQDGVIVTLYISYVEYRDKISLEIEDSKNYKHYRSEPIDETHFTFRLSDVKESKLYKANVFDGDNKIGSISFDVKSKMAKINPDFDFEDEL